MTCITMHSLFIRQDSIKYISFLPSDKLCNILRCFDITIIMLDLNLYTIQYFLALSHIIEGKTLFIIFSILCIMNIIYTVTCKVFREIRATFFLEHCK